MENSSNQNSWVPIQFCSNSGYELDQFLENSSNRQFYDFRAWHRPLSGKLIQNREKCRKMSKIIKECRGETLIDKSWKTYPEIFPKYQFSGAIYPNMDEFSRNRFSSCPEIEISRKNWMSFPEIGLWHAPENWNFGKISGWVFQNLPIRVNHNPNYLWKFWYFWRTHPYYGKTGELVL